MEEALVVDALGHNVKSMFRVSFTEDHVDYKPAEVELRTLAYPFGRCISFSSPPSPYHLSSLYVGFNNTAFQMSNITSDKVRVFFMEKVNLLHIYPNELEMFGDTGRAGDDILNNKKMFLPVPGPEPSVCSPPAAGLTETRTVRTLTTASQLV